MLALSKCLAGRGIRLCQRTPAARQLTSCQLHAGQHAWYCSAACQKADWKAHRSLCKRLRLAQNVPKAKGTALEPNMFMRDMLLVRVLADTYAVRIAAHIDLQRNMAVHSQHSVLITEFLAHVSLSNSRES